MENTLQSLVMPNLVFGAPLEMYVRLMNADVYSVNAEGKVVFRPTGHARFDTYFGGLTINAWKERAPVEDLSFGLEGSGQFIVRFGVHQLDRAHTYVQENVVTLVEGVETVLPIDAWPKLTRGMLYLELVAMSAGYITGGTFRTSTEPRRDVNLGIVVTHFNRKDYVLPAIERIRTELLEDPAYAGRIDMFVIDNSQNIEPEESVGVTVIKNENFGGAGGFTRGLLELRNRGTYTHCLFMDDDASCEVESIRRTYSVLRYALNDNGSVAGSLFVDRAPHILVEKGSQFDGTCKPLKHGYDMLDVIHLLLAEVNDISADYAGWFFFAFPAHQPDNLAFPFFVRGDDVRFGMDNDFDIITLNGIAVWGDDFGVKNGPLTTYLDVRNHLISMMTAIGAGPVATTKLLTEFVMNNVMSYNYASADAALLALEHVLQGPEFFEDNLDTSKIRAEVASYGPSEKLEPIVRGDYEVKYGSPHESSFRRLVRRATLNGNLLPDSMMKDDYIFQHKSFRAHAREVFRFKNIYYEYEPGGVGYVATRDRDRAREIVKRYRTLVPRFMKSYKKLSAAYLESWDDMTSEKMWRERLGA